MQKKNKVLLFLLVVGSFLGHKEKSLVLHQASKNQNKSDTIVTNLDSMVKFMQIAQPLDLYESQIELMSSSSLWRADQLIQCMEGSVFDQDMLKGSTPESALVQQQSNKILLDQWFGRKQTKHW